MELGYEAIEMGWNLTLRAPTRRALAMSNVWLKEDHMGSDLGGPSTMRNDGGRSLVVAKSMSPSMRVDPILGINLKGARQDELGVINDTGDMDHDLEDQMIIRGDGKKIPRRDSALVVEKKEMNSNGGHVRGEESNPFISMAVKGQADQS